MATLDECVIFHPLVMPEPMSGCWLWTGCGSAKYGQIRYEGRTQQAHRVFWEKENGPIPDGLFALHRCDIPMCVNPDHIFLGTQQENINDMMAKNRHHLMPRTKISWEQVQKIKKLYKFGNCSQRGLGIIFGISQRQVGRIINEKQRVKKWEKLLTRPELRVVTR